MNEKRKRLIPRLLDVFVTRFFTGHFPQCGRDFLKTNERICLGVFQRDAKSKPLVELERYLQNSSTDALIISDPDGLTSEDIRQLKELIRTTKTERPK